MEFIEEVNKTDNNKWSLTVVNFEQFHTEYSFAKLDRKLRFEDFELCRYVVEITKQC